MDDLEIRLGGSGGQGLQLSAKILGDALIREGRKVARSQSYEPTSRGGLSRADLVVSTASIDFPLVTALDYLVLLDRPAVAVSLPLLKPGALVIADARRLQLIAADGARVHALPLGETALALGNPRVTNIIALGAFASLSQACETGGIEAAIRDNLPPRLVDLNLRAFARGRDLAETADAVPG